MRILLDESVPRSLKPEFADHDVTTVPEAGWCGKKNGELLAAMADENYEVLLTVDQNLEHQQNLNKLQVAIIVMVARSNRKADLLPLMPAVRQALELIRKGTLRRIEQ